jgi:hypothetical protein
MRRLLLILALIPIGIACCVMLALVECRDGSL